MGPIARRAEAGLGPLEALMLLGKVTAAEGPLGRGSDPCCEALRQQHGRRFQFHVLGPSKNEDCVVGWV